MIIGEGFGGLIVLGLLIFCFVDVLLTPESACRTLPKLAWVFIVLILPLIGSIAWLVAGRSWTGRDGVSAAMRPRTTASGRPMTPDDDEEFLAGLRKRTEEQRRRARDEQNRPESDPSGM